MPLTRQINNKNAESISKPIIDNTLQLFRQLDHAAFLDVFPDLKTLQKPEQYNNAAASLKILGDTPSVEYLDRLAKPHSHKLLWKIQCPASGKAVLLDLLLSKNESVSALDVKAPINANIPASNNTGKMPPKSLMNEENVKSTGTPFIEKLLKSIADSDFKLYCELFPDTDILKSQEALEIFEEAVGVLKPMEKLNSIDYLTHTSMTNLRMLFWKLRYEKEDEELLWELLFTDDDGKVRLRGFSFDR